jgi:MYXO-CTERM domain-containing protein
MPGFRGWFGRTAPLRNAFGERSRFEVRRLGVSVALALGLLFAASIAGAQVVEPNGTQVPNLTPHDNETLLSDYFKSQGEAIDAVQQASPEPGTFSPLCDFTATLVLSQSSAAAGLAWYNVPASPTAKPDKLFQIVPEASAVTGQTVNAADIRSSANYAGGFIGFALTKFGGTAIYYSEYQRNANCTGCTMPGNWKMMLAYRSSVHQSAYYIAFEDWEGANDTTWFGNDGDFNDKVFLITGVSCPGGGEPCDTGKQGLCAAGLTECSFMGKPLCKQQYSELPEQCDNVDNDCNGQVDDGNLCPESQVCVRGKCVGACNTGEFNCPSPLVCGQDGFCIEAACKNVTCGAGLACRAGKCVGVCEGITCPIGQECELDRCVDPCAGITCATGTFCDRGVCVGDCTCSGCPQGKSCAKDGRCVEPGCDTVSCGAGLGCRNGACVDACDGALCPGGASCTNGVCGVVVVSAGGASAGGTPSSSGGLSILGNGGTTASGGKASDSAANGGVGTSAGGVAPRSEASASACGCRMPGSRDKGSFALAALTALAAAVGARRRRRP